MLRSALAATFLVSLSVAAQADRRPHPHQPPPEAIDACKTAKRGDTCSMTIHEHTITGTCDAPPDVSTLACRPDHPPPPPESFAACEQLDEGDPCTFTHEEHTISGTCSKGPHGEPQLGCKPEHPPHHP